MDQRPPLWRTNPGSTVESEQWLPFGGPCVSGKHHDRVRGCPDLYVITVARIAAVQQSVVVAVDVRHYVGDSHAIHVGSLVRNECLHGRFLIHPQEKLASSADADECIPRRSVRRERSIL